MILLWTSLWATDLAGGLFWRHRRDFEAVGGFNEIRSSLRGEDRSFSDTYFYVFEH